MRRGVPWLLLLACLGVAGGARAEDAFRTPFLQAERQSTSRIIDGAVAPPGSFPAALQLAHLVRQGGGGALREGFECGASLIAPRWALTAAHCLVGETMDGAGRPAPLSPTDVMLRGGAVALADGGSTLHPARIVIHPDYRPGRFTGDIALIEFQSDSDLVPGTLLGPTLAAAALAPKRLGATVIGWGSTDPRGRPVPAPWLLQVDVDLIPAAACRAAYGGVPVDHFCAGIMDRGRCDARGYCADSCQGDSGGPLYVDAGPGRVQAGVVSYGLDCGDPGHPGVYTSVAVYADWIASYVPQARFASAAPAKLDEAQAGFADVVLPPDPARPGLRPTVSLALRGPGSVHVGDALVLQVASNVSGRLLLFNADERGGGYLVAPNALGVRHGRGAQAIAPGRTRVVPLAYLDGFALHAGGPPGRSRFIAVVAPDDLPGLDDLLAPYLAQAPIARLAAWVRDLAARVPPGRIAVGAADYRVMP